jgi:hypothetical protein
MLARTLKTFHEIAAVGVLGSLAASLVLLWIAVPEQAAEFAELRRAIAALNRFILVPSLLLVLVTGLLSIAVTEIFKNAGWAWAKAASGIIIFEATLQAVGAGGKRAEALAQAAVAGGGDPVLLAQVLKSEWNTLCVLVVLSFANIILAVWRPRFGRRVARAPAPVDRAPDSPE